MKVIEKLHRQQGVALLVLFMILFVAASTVFLSAANSNARQLQVNTEIRYQLEQAKATLLAYAFEYESLDIDGDGDSDSDDQGPGRLPCPDTDNDGLPNDDPSTECADNVRGRLPEYLTVSGSRFTFNSTYADVDRQFWYVVSPAFKQTASGSLNPSDAGTFTVDGVSGYVAVIIAPGEAFSTQDRLSAPTTASSYLEAGNVSGTDFVNSYSADPDNFNDMVLGITWTELMTMATTRVAQEFKRMIDRYHNWDYCCSNYPHYPAAGTGFWDLDEVVDRAIDNTNYAGLWTGFTSANDDNDYDWYEDDGWEAIESYSRTDNNNAQLSFTGCGITFSMTHDGSLTRDQVSC